MSDVTKGMAVMLPLVIGLSVSAALMFMDKVNEAKTVNVEKKQLGEFDRSLVSEVSDDEGHWVFSITDDDWGPSRHP